VNTKERLYDRIQMLPSQSIPEDIASGIIHGIGILISIAALVILVVFASLKGNVAQVIAFSIFGGFAVLYYLCSTFHHSLTHYKAKRVFRIMEQSAVYLFFAGTIFPLHFVIMNSTWSWIFFLITAILCIIGILNLFLNKKNSNDIKFIINILLVNFLVIGILVSLKYFTPDFKTFFVPGCILYLIGFWFATMNGMKYNQSITHSFSLIATILHFFAFLELISF